MKKLIFLIAISFNISAATHYVSKAGSNIYPYASWETAAHSINDCVLSGPDDVLVADGTYYESNEIYLAGAMTVKSVNGADKTIVNGSGLHRCFYLTGSTIIDGFTITNGYSGAGSGVYCSSGGTINNCTISGNSATGYGGGTRNGTINNCTISGNSATGYGGGTYNSTIQNCVISGNSADDGGGVYDGTIKNCTISGNSANDGGGAYCSVYGDSTIKNCVISGNSADKGGGVYEVGGTIQNCTIIENTADNSGGGVYCDNDTRKIYNSIIYYNTAGNYDNIYRGDMKYSCSFPLRTDTGNIFFIPAFIDRAGGDYHLNKSSPCVNSGTNAFAPMPYDLDGNPRIMNGTVDMGAYELVPEPVSNAATHYVSKAGSNIYPYASWETAAHSINDCVLSGPDDVLVADGTYYESNEIYLAGAMTVKSVNGADKTIVNGSGLHRCFYLTGSTIIDGFTITNGYSGAGSGVYCSSGGTINNCTISGNSATGYGGGTYNSTIQNCVISGNSADDGGGVYDGTIKNCTISGNSANDGGGAYCSVYGDSTIKNCVISGNSADKGGGVYEVGGTIQNCTIIENTADNSGGGVYCDNDTRKIYNSIIYYNTAGNYDNIYRGDMKYSCSFPLRTDTGNIFFIPAFIDRAGGDYHLNKSSPCVNSGTNAFAPMPYDLDGNPRIMNGTVDMGAYELVPEPVSIFYLLLWAVIYFAKRS